MLGFRYQYQYPYCFSFFLFCFESLKIYRYTIWTWCEYNPTVENFKENWKIFANLPYIYYTDYRSIPTS